MERIDIRTQVSLIPIRIDKVVHNRFKVRHTPRDSQATGPNLNRTVLLLPICRTNRPTRRHHWFRRSVGSEQRQLTSICKLKPLKERPDLARDRAWISLVQLILLFHIRSIPLIHTRHDRFRHRTHSLPQPILHATIQKPRSDGLSDHTTRHIPSTNPSHNYRPQCPQLQQNTPL